MILLQEPHLWTTLYHGYFTKMSTMHNKNVFQITLGEIFAFLARDAHGETCLFHFNLSNLPFQMVGLH
jgi:hypothetical protein